MKAPDMREEEDLFIDCSVMAGGNEMHVL